jgi:hypothetical protein
VVAAAKLDFASREVFEDLKTVIEYS